MTSQFAWKFEDHDLPDFAQSDADRFLITSPEALRQELGRLQKLSPRVIMLRHTDGVWLDVGIGGDWMYIRLYPKRREQLPKIEVFQPAASPLPVSYSFEGQSHEMPPRYLFPVASGIDLVAQICGGEYAPSIFVDEYEDREAVLNT